ncbi:MAG: hypothetical protein ACD_8C00136G0001 [uncultured bacterium]|nr:MAG: hypothetical protein ACD_8C00136G0001 [uncultured bacterium]
MRLTGLFGFLPLLAGCSSPQLEVIGMHMLKSLMFAVPFVITVIVLIFLMNKYIVMPNGRTHDRRCSYVGIVIFPALFIFVLGWKFGHNWITMSVAIVLGLLIGWFSYTLDELMESFWEMRSITMPATLGLLLGGWMCTLLFTSVWLQTDMYVTHTACAKRVIIERYTHHYRSSENGGSYHSWDYHSHADRIVLGDTFPVLVENKDYVLQAGLLGNRDRVGKEEYYRFIGGNLFSKSKRDWKDYQWLLLSDNNLQFKTGKVQRVQSNFYGRPICNDGEVTKFEKLPNALSNPPLPIDEDLPPATTTFKVVRLGIDFVKIIFTQKEFADLRYIFLSVFVILGVVAGCFRKARQPILIFLTCCSIAPLLVFLVVAARTGSLNGLRLPSRDRFEGGGGKFGGGGSTGSW